MTRRLFLLDGSALVYRAYFAFIKNPLLNSRGENTSAAYGFVNSLLGLIEREEPDEIAVVFDETGTNFRHEMYEEYKATREKMPEELFEQLPVIRYLTSALGITVLRQKGVEADDIIGTLARRGEAEGKEVMIVSGDKDFAQLVTEKIKLYDPGRGGKGSKIVAVDDVIEKYGVRPDQIIDYMALVGDTSDNVPGVPKIGAKTAQKLISAHQTLDQLYTALDDQTRSMRERLEEHKGLAYLSRDLVTIRTDVEIEGDASDLTRKDVDAKELRRLFADLEFSTLLDRVAQIASGTEGLVSAQKQGQYHLVRDLEGLSEVLDACKEAGTLILQPLFAYVEQVPVAYALGLAHAEEEAWVVILAAEDDAHQTSSVHDDLPLFAGMSGGAEGGRPVGDASLTFSRVVQAMKPLLEDASVAKVGHDIKESLLLLGREGVGVENVEMDTMISAYLLNPSRPNQELDSLTLQLLSYRKMQPDEIRGSGRKKLGWQEVQIPDLVRYVGEETDLIARLSTVLHKELEDSALLELVRSLEMPLVPVLAKMERTGVALDVEFLHKMQTAMDERLQAMMAEIQTYTDREDFNVNSSQQIAALLYDKLQLHEKLGVKLRKTKKSKNYSTNSETLKSLSGHPLPALILEYRELQKLLSTYIEALPAQAILDASGKPRIHTRFRQAHTATGRLSSFSPNLQNIPTRTEQGREIRKAFVPGPSGWQIVSADYSQVELRLLAHISKDPVLTEAFHQGLDIHARTAGLIFDVPPEDVSSSQRSAAKAIHFGIIYGMGPPRLAKEIDVSVDDAGHFIKAYFKSYPKVKAYLDNTVKLARKQGYVETLMGRRRYVHDLDSKDGRLRAAAHNIAVNTPIQGSAADLIKLAMIRIDARLQQMGLKARMLLQIHDELLFEAPKDELETLEAMLKEEMSGAMTLDIPLVVDIDHGDNWAEAH